MPLANLTQVQPFNINSSASFSFTDVNANNLVISTSANLGSVSNVTVTGGATDQVLSTDGTGNLSWTDQTGGSRGATIGKSIALAIVFGF